MVINIENILQKVLKTVDTHRLESEGEYARWLWQNEKKNRKLGLNEYGCADAANILYTLGCFPSDSESRRRWIEVLQSLQDPQTGLFCEETHHFIHTTAHCVAALELFDAKPLQPLTELTKYADKAGLYSLLESLDWKNNAWSDSHLGAGIYAAMVLTDSVDETWIEDYFAWLWENADPETGFWRKGAIGNGSSLPHHHMAGTFHYLFNHQHAHRPLRYPEKMVDTCIALYEEKRIGKVFGENIGFLEIDWVYCLNRACRQSGYRHQDCQRVMERFAKEYADFLGSIDHETHDGFNDLHMLFGSVCALAELQQGLPGVLKSKKPLKLVLDRRPFI